MAKPKNTNKPQSQNQVKYSDPRESFMSTKSNMMIKELDFKLKDIFKTDYNETAVLAEDQNGLYITGKSYIDALVLDPFRQYERNKIKITKSETGYDIETTFGSLISVAL